MMEMGRGDDDHLFPKVIRNRRGDDTLTKANHVADENSVMLLYDVECSDNGILLILEVEKLSFSYLVGEGDLILQLSLEILEQDSDVEEKRFVEFIEPDLFHHFGQEIVYIPLSDNID